MFNYPEKEYNHRHNNQVIIHTEINNYNPLKEYIINLNNIENNNNKYKRNLSPILPKQKSYIKKNNYIHLQKELNNNSFSKVNEQNNKIVSIQITKQIKPYKKKSVLFNPNQSKEKYNNYKLDLTNYSETINSNCITDRTFDKSKISFIKEEDLSFSNINDNKSNNNIFENQTFDNKQINSFIYNNKNIHKLTNYNNSTNTNKKLCRKIPLSKKYIPNKNFQLNNNNHKNNYKNDIIPNIITNYKYHKRFTKILILLIEKYFKTYLLKIKYLFMNNLRSYKKGKRKSIKSRNNNIPILYETKCLTDRNNENKNNSFYKTKYRSRNENILIQRFKNENIKNSSDKVNFIELFRNKNELFKKEIIINRRKDSKNKSKSQNQSQTKENNKKILNHALNNNIIKKNKSIDNIGKFKKNNSFYNKTKPLLIIKKLKTRDNRINIDIKYLAKTIKNNKTHFKKLKISSTNSISIIRKGNKILKFDKIYYKIDKQDNYNFMKGKKLSCIQEEE